jgi:hypothetical protein
MLKEEAPKMKRGIETAASLSQTWLLVTRQPWNSMN